MISIAIYSFTILSLVLGVLGGADALLPG